MKNKTRTLGLLALLSSGVILYHTSRSYQPLQDLPRILIAQGSGEVVEHTGYTLSYSEAHEQAEWVAYTVSVNEINTDVARTDNFRADPKISTGSAALADYKGSGYDRGHLAPAADMKENKLEMSESFFMSNMSPQHPSFNRGGWKKLEDHVRSLVYTQSQN